MHQTVVNADGMLSCCSFINTFANVIHNAKIGDYCNISTKTMINGESNISVGNFIRSKSAINQYVKIEGWGADSLAVSS